MGILQPFGRLGHLLRQQVKKRLGLFLWSHNTISTIKHDEVTLWSSTGIRGIALFSSAAMTLIFKLYFSSFIPLNRHRILCRINPWKEMSITHESHSDFFSSHQNPDDRDHAYYSVHIANDFHVLLDDSIYLYGKKGWYDAMAVSIRNESYGLVRASSPPTRNLYLPRNSATNAILRQLIFVRCLPWMCLT